MRGYCGHTGVVMELAEAPMSLAASSTGRARVRVICVAAAALIAVALSISAFVLTALNQESLWYAVTSPAVLVSAAVGLLVALRRPRNLIGWVLLASALALGCAFLAEPYARYALVTDPGSLPAARWAVLWDRVDWPTMFAGMTALAFLFPDGRLLPGRWRKVAIGALASFAGLMVAVAFEPQHFSGDFAAVHSPLPALPALVRLLLTPFWIGAYASLIAAAWAIVVRFRRSRGVERLQMLWLTYAALLVPAALVACLAEELVTGQIGRVTTVAIVVAVSAIPVAVAIAVFRYRLFDIELILSRTIVYGTLSLTVVATYLGLVVGLDRLVHVRGVAGALAAALVALGAQPLRHLLQGRVRRFVYGDRSDPYVALARLGERLQATPDPAEVLTTIVDSVAVALRLGYAAIELERHGAYEVAATRGRPRRAERTTIPLTYQGEKIVGSLVVEPPPGAELTPSDRRLLDDLARQAGVAVHAVRLTADLQRSRERLVSAREEERRRLRRDLHDGLGPALASIVLKLDATRSMPAEDRPRVDMLLTELRSETQEAIADIRRLVYELRPPALDELGLIGALSEQATRLSQAGGPRIAVDGPDDLLSLPAAVEVAAYRIAAEALTNAARHASARACSVSLSCNGALELAIADDGGGIPGNRRAGVGLASMQERAEELGGTCTITPRPGGGTLVQAMIPLHEA
jgi:two-component system, NarL family, sensor kinase